MQFPSPLSRRHLLCGTLATSCGALVGGRVTGAAPIDSARILRVGVSGYDGRVPGPALEVARGEEVHIRAVNELTAPTAIHWHGVRLVNAMDGAPPLTQKPIAPGESFDYRFMTPDAGTFWYHPPRPGPQGLYGSLTVREPEPVDADRDVGLIFGAAAGEARTLLVNGVANFDISARANERLRLRFINACGNRMIELRVAGLRTFVMATDGQPAQPFAARDSRLTLGPGNRIDALVDCDLAPGGDTSIEVKGASDVPAIRIMCETRAPGRAALREDPHPLPSNPLPERMEFRGAFRLDAAAGSMRSDGHALFAVKRGRTVVLGLLNSTSESSSIHLHGHSFRLLDALDDGWKPFWLDTLPVAPQSRARIAFIADNPGKWPIEGLVANGPDAWFEVT